VGEGGVRERGCSGVREGAGGEEGEMTQTLYAHRDKIKIKNKKSKKKITDKLFKISE
jgi:hypothetical protein